MATSCASPTATNSVRGSRPGQDRSPPHPLLMPQRSPGRTLRGLLHLDAIDTPVDALDRRERSADGLRTSPRSASRSLARRQPLLQGGVVSGPRFPHGLRGTTVAHAASIDEVAREGRPGRHAAVAGNPAATTNDESYHGSTSELPPATSHGYKSGTSPECRTQ
jgi:hypothetical protein